MAAGSSRFPSLEREPELVERRAHGQLPGLRRSRHDVALHKEGIAPPIPVSCPLGTARNWN
jgi:hypothetical protein